MGFIKLDRKFQDWKWKRKPNMVAVWVHLLLKANYKDNEWQNSVIPKGSFITSISEIARETGLTIQQTRTCISNLQITNEITVYTTNKYTLITINKWEEYQSNEENQQANQQAIISKSNKQITNKLTTSKEVKNSKNIESICSESKKLELNKQIKEVNKKNKYGEYKNVLLTDNEFDKLGKEYGVEVHKMISFLDEYIERKGYKAKNHYLTIKKWVADAVREEEERKQKRQRTRIILDETIPEYDDTNNPSLDTERLNKLLEKRKKAE